MAKPTYTDLEKQIKELQQTAAARQASEAALKASLQKLRLHVKQSPLAVIEWDLNFRVAQWNPAARRIFGYTAEQAMGRHAAFIIPDMEKEQVDQVWETLIHNQGCARSTNRNVTRQGRAITCEWYNTPLVGPDNRVMGITSLVMDVTAREQSEKALRESENKYRLLVENQTDLVIKLDEHGRFVFASPSFCRMFDKTQTELLGTAITPFIHPQDQPGTEKKLAELFSPPNTAAAELRAKTKQGWAWLSWVGTAVLDAQGRVTDVVCVGRDITDQKQMETALKKSEQRFREIIEDVAEIAIQGYSESLDVTFWNKASEKLYGFSREEALGKNIEELIIPEQMLDSVHTAHKNWLENGEKIPPGELLLKGKGGRDVPVFSSHALVNTPRGREMFCVDVDLAPLRETEKALRESQELFSVLTTNTSTLVSIHDSNANYIFANQAHSRLGVEPEALIGQSGFTLVHPNDVPVLEKNLEKAWKGQISKAVLDYRIIDSQGRTHFFRGNFDGVFKPDGTLERIVAVCEDTTELLRAQEEKEAAFAAAAEAKKQALVGQVAGKMSHDFNNILGIIMGLSELALMDCRDEKTRADLHMIHEQSIRGKNLTRNLLAFARSQEPRQEFFSINEKVDLVINLMKKDLDNISLTVSYGSGIPELLADPGMMEHTMVNLIQNAVHATCLTAEPDIRIRTWTDDKQICFEVADNGCGIPEKHLDQIFEPSFTLKGSRDKARAYPPEIKGTGYGMANVKKYIDQHKGRIEIGSVPGEGTQVKVCLPMIRKQRSRDEKVCAKKQVSQFGKTILLVEDEAAISEVQYRLLTQAPCRHTVDVAQSADEAMDLIDRNRYDFISLDYILKGRETGMRVYHHIRKKEPDIPVLFISGNMEFLESIRDLKGKDPFLDHLSKPCQNTEYLEAVDALIARAER